jgi:hypothetical protein
MVKVGSKKRWDTRSLAIYGALLGSFLGFLEQFCHAFCPASWRHEPSGNLFVHVLLEVVFGAVTGAALFAAVAAIRNRLIRDR